MIRGDYRQLPDNFDDIFPCRLDEIVIPFSGEADFDTLVEKFEDLEDLTGGTLSEDDDSEIIKFQTIQGLLILIRMSDRELIIHPRGAAGCIKMIEEAKKGLLEFSASSAKLLN
jgi:hypothetical protein